MSFSAIADNLRRLRLTGMLKAYEYQQVNTAFDSMSFDERLNILLTEEDNFKEQRKLARLLKEAKLKYAQACVEDIDYKPQRLLDRQLIANLTTCNWLRNHQGIILTGATGCGKTWLACAIWNLAARNGYSVLYKRIPALLEALEIAHADGSLPRLRQQLSKCRLLILDDWGLTPLTELARHDLLEIVDDRSNQGSIIITSQLPVAAWHQYIGDPTIADAILDRLIHSSHRLNLGGESMRKQINL